MIRLVVLIALLALAGTTAAFIVTGQQVWRQRAVRMFSWIVVGGIILLGFAIFMRLVGRVL